MEDLKRRLGELKCKLPEFAGELSGLDHVVDEHFTLCFNPIRRLTEKVLHELCHTKKVSWGRMLPTLENMSGPLSSRGLIPKEVKVLVDTIQVVASPGCHLGAEKFSRTHVTIALLALVDVLGWYYTLHEGQSLGGVERPRAESGGLTAEARDIVKIRGGRPLQGEVVVRGAKNTLPKHMVASLLTCEPCKLQNVADIRDVQIMEDILRALGGSVEPDGNAALEISTADIDRSKLVELSRFAGQSRIPILLCAPLLHRFGEAVLVEPGGCQIGPRNFDYHVEALQKMGAVFEEREGVLYAKADRLRGCQYRLPYASVGATEQILLAAVLADGQTVLENASAEPEVGDLVKLLQRMEAEIHIHDDRSIVIQGVEKLKGFNYKAMADRSEVASWACAAAATDGKIFVRNARPDDLDLFLAKYSELGGAYDIRSDGIEFWRKDHVLRPVNLETACHPGFRTDWGPPFVVALTQARGTSEVHETVFEDRFCYARNLDQRRAKIKIVEHCLGPKKDCRFKEKNQPHSAIIEGPVSLGAADITLLDLRGGFACVTAALVADGGSILRNFTQLEKGYEHIYDKLLGLGAQVGPA